MCSIALTYPARSHFQCTLNREKRDKGLDERCRSSREGEEWEDGQEKGWRRQANFKEAACYSSAVVQRAARRKNALCEGSARDNWDPWKGQQHFNPTQTGSGTAPPRWGSCWLVQFNFARFTCTYDIYDRNFSLHYPKRSETIRVLGTNRRSVIIVTVKVNSKSELVENREGNQCYTV